MPLSPGYVEHQNLDGFGQPANLYTYFGSGRGIIAGYSTHYRILDLACAE